MGYSYGGDEGKGSGNNDNWWLLLVILLLLVAAGVVVVAVNVTLFEDGSIQFFNRLGWGFCLIRSWGCS